MGIKLERIINDETEEIGYKIRKSFISSLSLTRTELKKLQKLIKRELSLEYKSDPIKEVD